VRALGGECPALFNSCFAAVEHELWMAAIASTDVRSQHGDTAIAVMDELGFLTAEDI
jgi:hypothetical protein